MIIQGFFGYEIKDRVNARKKENAAPQAQNHGNRQGCPAPRCTGGATRPEARRQNGTQKTTAANHGRRGQKNLETQNQNRFAQNPGADAGRCSHQAFSTGDAPTCGTGGRPGHNAPIGGTGGCGARRQTRPRPAQENRTAPHFNQPDVPAAPALAGPGEKFSLGPVPATPGVEPDEAELPEAYGTKKLFLTARDPHWLYAHWDLTTPQQHGYNAESSDGHLVVRIYDANFQGHPAYEIHVHPESRHWFVHVERAGNSYCAELGYYSPLGGC